MPVNLCESFIEERQYLKNVSAKTIEWYQNAFRVFSGCGLEEPDSQILTRLKTRVVKLAKEGHKDISINTYTRVINAYLRWSHQEGHLSQLLKLPKLKETQTVITPFRPEHISALLACKPDRLDLRRVRMIALLILDSGIRIDEALSLERRDVNLDDLLLTLRTAKGRKQRIVVCRQKPMIA